MNKKTLFSAAAIAILSLNACATSSSSSPDIGERISARGGKISNYGETWSAGQKDVNKGTRLIEKSGKSAITAQKRLENARADFAKAEAQIKKAEQDRANGQQLVSDGTVQMQRAENDYAALRAGPSANPNAPQN